MPRTLPNPDPAREVHVLDAVRRVPAKARLAESGEGPAVSGGSPAVSSGVARSPLDRLAGTIEAALNDAHGSQKAVALTLEIDASQLKRQFRLGTLDLRRLAASGEAALAKVGQALVEEYGGAQKSARQIAKEQLPQLLAVMLAGLEEE